MQVYKTKYKYQLIYPIVGNKLYQATSLKGGAKRCYDELKQLDNIESDYFTVMNVDTFETFKFKIHPRKKNILKYSSFNKNVNPNMVGGVGSGEALIVEELDRKIDDVIRRVDQLETRFNNVVRRQDAIIDEYIEEQKEEQVHPPAYAQSNIGEHREHREHREHKQSVDVIEGPLEQSTRQEVIIRQPVQEHREEHPRDIQEIVIREPSRQQGHEEEIRIREGGKDININLIDEEALALGETGEQLVSRNIYNMNLKKLYEARMLKKIQDQEDKRKLVEEEGESGCTIM
ncbi:MAG: hypothetical protein Terrestrivirus3_188 [Terrestrivirus sp.]|uniref:Uncharacterized protein n=1 Tax=Terrestrivirus sp. TaxID=2487775 RepID=A0A3G4ZR70_9VIRU|nr:MAG: hypothetical protein Terrestrivirus3_188 [Terrestrivirus sp.]